MISNGLCWAKIVATAATTFSTLLLDQFPNEPSQPSSRPRPRPGQTRPGILTRSKVYTLKAPLPIVLLPQTNRSAPSLLWHPPNRPHPCSQRRQPPLGVPCSLFNHVNLRNPDQRLRMGGQVTSNSNPSPTHRPLPGESRRRRKVTSKITAGTCSRHRAGIKTLGRTAEQ